MPEQSELMLYVKTATSAGGGGYGGPGGSGGSGGRGGRGGSGGRGGNNTCKDDKGNPTHGPDGSNGWNGSDGRDGSSGRSGSSGRNGGSGRSGSKSFNLVNAAGAQSFAAPFDLDVTASTFLDDSGDSILEPGERAYLSRLQVTNKGPMPSPVGQAIKFQFLTSSVLKVPAELEIALQPIGPSAASVTDLKKGTLTLLVPDDNKLIGKKAVSNVRMKINNVVIDSTLDTGMSVKWPASLSAAASKSSHNFEVGKQLQYTLKNVGSAPLGPQGTQPVYIYISWSSAKVPGSDVFVTLPDGRKFDMAKPVVISDLTIPANSTLPLNLNFLARDSKLLSSASGVLSVALKLKGFSAPNADTIQSLDTAINLSLDTKAIEWNQTLNLAGMRVQCQFPNLTAPVQPISGIQINKAKGSDKMAIQVAVPGSTSSGTSPVISVSDSRMMASYVVFTGSWNAQNVVDFLNKVVSPSSPKGPWLFKGCSLAP